MVDHQDTPEAQEWDFIKLHDYLADMNLFVLYPELEKVLADQEKADGTIMITLTLEHAGNIDKALRAWMTYAKQLEEDRAYYEEEIRFINREIENP